MAGPTATSGCLFQPSWQPLVLQRTTTAHGAKPSLDPATIGPVGKCTNARSPPKLCRSVVQTSRTTLENEEWPVSEIRIYKLGVDVEHGRPPEPAAELAASG